MGAPTTDPQSTDLIFPVPTSRVSSRPGDEDPEHPGEQEAEEEEDRSLFQDFPGSQKDTDRS